MDATGSKNASLIREVSLFQRLICTQKYTIISEIREASLAIYFRGIFLKEVSLYMHGCVESPLCYICMCTYVHELAEYVNVRTIIQLVYVCAIFLFFS